MAQEATNLKKVDPLDLLRDFAIRKKTIVPEGDEICFGDQKFPSNTRTRFHSNKGEPQTLQTLWFCLAQEKKSHADYVKKCQQFKYNFLTLLDRTELLKYLNGKILSSNRIKTLSDDDKKQEKETLKRSGAGQLEGGPASKRAKTGGEVGEGVGTGAGARGRGAGVEKGSGGMVLLDPKDERFLEAKKSFGECLETIGTGFFFFFFFFFFFPSLLFSTLLPQDSPQTSDREALKAFFQADVFATKRIIEKERVQNTPESFLLDNKKDFSKLLKKLDDLRPEKKSSGSRPGEKGGETPKRPLQPIIVVPSVVSSLLTVYNCVDFLRDDQWVSPMTRKEQGVKKAKFMTFEKVLHEGEDPVTFRVTDSPVHLTEREWKDVAVVFALGADWQFKGWLYPNPAVLFSRVLGFYFTFDDMKIPPAVKQWNVKIISVDRRHRHLDRVAANTFWDLVRNWLRRLR